MACDRNRDEHEYFLHVQGDSRQHEWEIISNLYNFINANEVDMIGFRDHDVKKKWSSSFVDEDTSRYVVKFICVNRKVNTIVTSESLNRYSFESLGEKKKLAYNKILENYRGGSNIKPFCMIKEGTTCIGKSYLTSVIKQEHEIDSLPHKVPLLLLTPISVATFNIFSSTIHSTLCISVKDMTD